MYQRAYLPTTSDTERNEGKLWSQCARERKSEPNGGGDRPQKAEGIGPVGVRLLAKGGG